MQFKKVFAVAAVAGVALAADKNNSTLTTATPSVTKDCSFSDFTATQSAQVAQVAACPTAVGDITIYGDAFGNIDLTGLEQVYGDLSIKNATKAAGVNAPTLQLVSGSLELNANTILSNLNLAQLTTVGTLNFNALPALETTGLTAGITSADSVIISDTGLSSLTGINVFELKTFNVNNNDQIETINSGLKRVTDTLDISYNAEKVDVTLDQLTGANNIILQSINSISAQNLTVANGSVAVSSSSVDKVQFKKLQTIGKSLTINKNDDLEELDFPKLTSIGGALEISDNDKLDSFDGFPQLKTIGGSVNMNGTFNNGTFESLQRVAGGFTLKTDGELSCQAFNKLNSNGDVKGDKFQCEDRVTTTSSSSKKNGSTETDSSDDSTGAAETTTSKKNDAPSPAGKLASVVAAFAAIGVALI
ncbi:3-prime end of extracellular mutant protein [Spathaspora passalidarum NRRL Y-27907]|uniref:3-prime end of extracellular mutant protein n=1 Tax=Spathaspora passalidarum (strain NRRL Y-27907 / 11-Y1) TaxID=619300 RepID=G3AFH1_SPAPN|nr:3-prime end of extracellular mutant protein [Spathaspora passalidarum NRRL Y-27907]EGW34960.1 3-prime end of extracellular mutant protein [Spathaspora passalidarum NRRL Y-27907]